MLISQAIHTVDLLQWLLGDVTGVDGHVGRSRAAPGVDVEDIAALVLDQRRGTQRTGRHERERRRLTGHPGNRHRARDVLVRDDLTVRHADGRVDVVPGAPRSVERPGLLGSEPSRSLRTSTTGWRTPKRSGSAHAKQRSHSASSNWLHNAAAERYGLVRHRLPISSRLSTPDIGQESVFCYFDAMAARPDELSPSATALLGDRAYPESQVSFGGATYWLERSIDGVKRLVAVLMTSPRVPRLHGHCGKERWRDSFHRGDHARKCPGAAVRAALAEAVPLWITYLRRLGDRLGWQHPVTRGAEDGRFGHQPGVQPIREMGRCHRTARNVLDDATWGAFQAGWTRPVGGDADHLEELDDIDETVAAGFVFYTLDPKAEVDPEAEHADPAAIQQKVEALDWTGLDSDGDFMKRYAGRRIDLEREAIVLDEESVLRAMAKYGPSLAHAMAMYRRLMEKGIDCEVEFAVDETDYPTKPAEHVVVVSELKRLGMDFVSFAPRRPLREGCGVHRRHRGVAA